MTQSHLPTTRKRMLRIGVYVTLSVIVLIVLLHPFTRQALFGPTIEDLPLCYWQDGFRHWAAPDANRDSLTTKVVRWLGFAKREEFVGIPKREEDYLTLLLSMVDDPQPHVRVRVAYSLGGRITSEKRAPALQRLLDDPEATVRAAAASSLSSIGPDAMAAMPRLRELLEDPDTNCRVQAAWAVWKVSNQKPPEAVSILRQALKDTNANTRIEAAHILDRLGKDGAAAFPELVGCAMADPHIAVRTRCVTALGRLGQPAVPVLLKLLRDPDPQVAVNAAVALGNIGPDAKEAIPALQALQDSPDRYLQNAARDSLHRIDPEQFTAQKAEPE